MTSRITDARLPEIGRTVREVAAELTAVLGGVVLAPADQG
jgi:IclR family acetate operon transcriptional repressor